MIIAIGLYSGFTTLDAIGPYQVFSTVPGAEVVLCAAETGTLDDDHNLMHLRVDATFADVPRPDILLIPGGPASLALARDSAPIVDWVRNAHPHTRWTASVCTGALILGAAGLLDNRPAATHWHFYDELAKYGAQRTEERIVIGDRIATGAGSSAGIDLALTLVAEFAGPELAQGIQLALEYDPEPPFDSGSPSKAAKPIVDTVSFMIDAFEKEYSRAVVRD
ncbi:DJ-1/PfpI family protein [Nocardia sp. CDC159]|uniref:DJ-1/PfpI family protein n=1 Tax=Nocardia pulmonis TaxID=2951408 RepID=A0A9X2EDG9_9NOCA|nr:MULTISPECIES: DJ-1/PfpI family protein [Nocardia]MCM6778887.1 DJ-1/PfpI family protein [Nocardia pulmonis]MCM6791776.1 DJ-1/PfpI family protein [Nocardia sp. CDC159]